MAKKYIVDIYVEGCDSEGFREFTSLANARAYARGYYDSPYRAHLCDDQTEKAAAEYPGSDVTPIETWSWRSRLETDSAKRYPAECFSDYATIYRIDAQEVSCG